MGVEIGCRPIGPYWRALFQLVGCAPFEAELKLRVPDSSWFFKGSAVLVFPPLLLNSVETVDADQTAFEFRVERKTAPGPVLREGNQAALRGNAGFKCYPSREKANLS